MSSDFNFERAGIVFIVSAPSGAGKTTLARLALERVAGLSLSVSCTTRKPRPGEVDGTDYKFLTEEEFRRRIEGGRFAEWAKVHGCLYGTEKAPLEAAISEGRDIMLDIDVQGAEKIKTLYPAAVSVFVLPPSLEELERRLRGRGTDSEETIRARLERARQETERLRDYEYYIVNRDLGEAADGLVAIIEAERHRVARIS